MHSTVRVRWRKAEVKEVVACIEPTREPTVLVFDLSLPKSFGESDSGFAVVCIVELSLMTFFSEREILFDDKNFFISFWTWGCLRTKPRLIIIIYQRIVQF